MTHPALPLQKAIIDTLKTDPDVSAIVKGRVYDHVPPKPVFPYVVLANEAFTRDLWQHECFVDVQFFTQSTGRPAVKRLGEAVIAALDRLIIIEGFDTDEGGLEDLNYFQEDTGETQMGEASFRYLVGAEEDLFKDE